MARNDKRNTENPFSFVNGDCVEGIKKLKDESVHLSIFSPPFADLYTYSDSPADMGNSRNYEEFFQHFSFLTPELFRVLKPGRIVAVHCMDLPIQKGKEGHIGLRDFSGMLVKNFQEHGFIYHSRVTCWKNPVTEMQRTKALGLLHKQIKKDSTMSRVGIPDYVLCFRKEGENAEPVANEGISVDTWQQWASPVWMDIDTGDTLQYMSARDGNDEKHICPMSLQTIQRLIQLYSNAGDLILDPFGGICSTGYKAIEMNRTFVGFELKKSYYEQGMKNINAAVKAKSQIILDVAECATV